MGVKGLYAKGPPAGPVWLLWIKIAIIVLSLIVLALAAYAISVYGKYGAYYYGSTGAPGLLIFVVIKTWIVYGALLFFELKAPQFFYRLIGLVGYSFGIIFWLSGWAWAASYASLFLSVSSYCVGGFGCSVDTNAKAFGGAMAGCAAIGAIIWVLSIVNLVFFVRGCLADEGTPAATAHNAELGHVPKQAEGQAQPVYGAPQQTQPVYGQQQQPAYGAPQQAYGQQPVYGAQPGQQQTPYGGAPPPQQQYPTQ